MFTHHIVTVTLITFSYVTNLTRVGTLTLCLHDAADVVLEVRKYMCHQCLYMVLWGSHVSGWNLFAMQNNYSLSKEASSRR